MEVASEDAFILSILDGLAKDVEIVGDFLLRQQTHELQTVPQFDLRNDGQRAVASEGLQMMTDGDADSFFGTADVGDGALERLQIVARVLAEDRDEQIFLAVEVEIDGAVGDAGRLRDLRHLGVEVAVPREDVDGGAEDALAFGGALERGRLRGSGNGSGSAAGHGSE